MRRPDANHDRTELEPTTLYVVATPLGNLSDLSQRAAEVLNAVTLVAAEDTRRTRILLKHIGATPRVISFHAHSAPGRLSQLVNALADGQHIALLTDAGTPTVSDPGARLVAAAHAIGSEVVAVPGPSAVTAALSVSGIVADRYTFFGFTPRKGKQRRQRIKEIGESRYTGVLFEAANRLTGLLHDLIESCGGERQIAVARELTKVHEEVKSGTLSDLAVYYEEHVPKGEVTIVVSGRTPLPPSPDQFEFRRRAQELLESGMSRKDVATQLAEELAMPRNEAKRMVTEL